MVALRNRISEFWKSMAIKSTFNKSTYVGVSLEAVISSLSQTKHEKSVVQYTNISGVEIISNIDVRSVWGSLYPRSGKRPPNIARGEVVESNSLSVWNSR